MTQELIERINFLAKKSREQGLTEHELAEQKELRAAYVAAFRFSLVQQLDHTVVLRPDGSKERVVRKHPKK